MAERERSQTPPFGGVFVSHARIMTADAMGRAVRRMAHEVIERNHGLSEVVVIGLQTGGVPVAVRLVETLEEIEGIRPPLGTLDVALVQGGGPQRTRATPTGAAQVFANQVEANQLVEAPVDLVVWPENVVNPVPLPATGEWRRQNHLYADDASAVLAAEDRRTAADSAPAQGLVFWSVAYD